MRAMLYYDCASCNSENIFSREYYDRGLVLKCYKCKGTNLVEKEMRENDCSSPFKLNMVSQNGSTLSKCTPEFRERLKSIKNYYKDSNIDC